VAAYVKALRALDANSRALAMGANAQKLIPNLHERCAVRAAAQPVQA
jgi:hypothetical protein